MITVQQNILAWELSIRHFQNNNFMQNVISKCFMIDNINILVYSKNHAMLTLDDEAIRTLLIKYPDLEMSDSASDFVHSVEVPLGIPVWFLSAYPDIALYFLNNIEEVDFISEFEGYNKSIIKTNLAIPGDYFGSVEEMENRELINPISAEGGLEFNILMGLKNYFMKKFDKPLECQL